MSQSFSERAMTFPQSLRDWGKVIKLSVGDEASGGWGERADVYRINCLEPKNPPSQCWDCC